MCGCAPPVSLLASLVQSANLAPPARHCRCVAGQPYGGALTVLGVLLGGAFIRRVQQQLAAYEDIEFGALQGSAGAQGAVGVGLQERIRHGAAEFYGTKWGTSSSWSPWVLSDLGPLAATHLAARKTALMVGIMAAHALGEGCAVGVSFCGDRGWAQVGMWALMCTCASASACAWLVLGWVPIAIEATRCAFACLGSGRLQLVPQVNPARGATFAHPPPPTLFLRRA